MNDPDTIALISKNNILIIDLQGRKPIRRCFTKLDYFEGADYKSEENALYFYQYSKNLNKFNCEIVSLNNMGSEVITSDSRAAISRKDDLMISFDSNKERVFKAIDLNPNVFLFNWENVPGKESDLLIRFLKDEYEFNLKKIEVNKSDDGKSINIFNHELIAEIPVAENEKIIEYSYKKLKITRHGSDLVITGGKYYSDKFNELIYFVKNFEEIQDNIIDVDSRKLLNYLNINTG